MDRKRKFSSPNGPSYSEKSPHQQRGLCCCCFPRHSSVFFRNNNTSVGCSSSKRRAEDVGNNKVISVVGGGESTNCCTNHKGAETSRRPEEARSGLPQQMIELGLEETMAEMIVAEHKGGEEVQRGREEVQHRENPSPTCYNSNREQQPVVMGLAESSQVDAGAAKKEPELIDLASEESCAAEEEDEVIMDREKDEDEVIVDRIRIHVGSGTFSPGEQKKKRNFSVDEDDDIIVDKIVVPLVPKKERAESDKLDPNNVGNKDEIEKENEASSSAASSDVWIEKLDQLRRDISLGVEHIPIPVVNEVDGDVLPARFDYVRGLVQGSKSMLLKDTVEGCDCEGECSSFGCICFFKQEGTIEGKCAYQKGGVLISKYDLKRCPVIRECSSACSCNESCKNRVCQKGIKYRMEIFKTPHMGWGVRAAEHIPKQVFLAEYAGEMLEAGKDVEDRGEDDDSYLFEMDESIGHSVDGRRKGNVSRFFNHSCRPTLQALSVQCGDEKEGVFHSAFFTTRTVRKGEELTLDYSDRYWFPKGKEGMFCKCGARKCRYSEKEFPVFAEQYKKKVDEEEKKNQKAYWRDVEIAIKQSLLPQND